MFKNSGQYSKLVVSVLGSIATGLQLYYGDAHWVTVVISGITAATIYLVLNTPKVGG